MHSLACSALLNYLVLVADQVRHKILEVSSKDVLAGQVFLLVFPAWEASVAQLHG